MKPQADLHPHVYPTGDGERSTAGSNYGDWRPAQPHGPHGYDFESRFPPPELDPDFRRLREEYERELDAHYPHWRAARYRRFAEDFGRWREQRAVTAEGEGADGERPG